MKYVVVLPAKNEEQHIERAIESMVCQTLPPQCVMVVDDGSDDRTPDIVEKLASKHDVVKHISTGAEGEYELGAKVVRAFLAGKQAIDSLGIEYDWIIKQDADLEFDKEFMSKIEQEARNRHLGIASGTPYFEENGHRIYDTSPEWHTHGQFKIYNRECFDQIGGPRPSLGWDCADNVAAIDHGWECIAFRDINYLMHRSVGGKSSLIKGRMNHGLGCYQIGVGPGYFLLKASHDVIKEPYVVGALSLLRGYLRGFFGRYPKTLPPQQRRLLRRLFWSSMWKRFRKGDFLIQQRISPRRQSQ